jgi:hypothetical protein
MMHTGAILALHHHWGAGHADMLTLCLELQVCWPGHHLLCQDIMMIASNATALPRQVDRRLAEEGCRMCGEVILGNTKDVATHCPTNHLVALPLITHGRM